MGFPVWDALADLPMDGPARCGVAENGQPKLLFVCIGRGDPNDHAVHTMSFNPSAPLREREIGPRWLPRSMAADAALALIEPLARKEGRELRAATRELMTAILHGEAQTSALTVNGRSVPSLRFELGRLVAAVSTDPSLLVAVATLGMPIPEVATANADAWRTAVTEAIASLS